MQLEHKTFQLELKEADKPGEFSGHLSVFGVMDQFRDIVMPGAFKKSLQSWRKKGRLPPLLWQHDAREPLGPFTSMKEDEKGLLVEGRLLIDDLPRAKQAHALMKNDVVTGMSIGFVTVTETEDRENMARKLTEIDLWEGSIVTFPANPSAQIEQVKSIIETGKLPDLKTFERFLREAGFSKSQAVAIASHGLSHLLRSDSESEATIAATVAFLKSLKTEK